MKILFCSIIFISISLLSGCNIKNDIEPESRTTEEVRKTVINNTEYSLAVINKGLPWGRWVKQPSSIIPPYNRDVFITRGTPLAGTEGFVEYSIYNGSFKVHWNHTHWGKRKHYVEVNDPHGRYDIYCSKCNSNNFTIYVNQRVSASNYNIIVMSDPQAWRLSTAGNNPNKDKSKWESVNKKVVESINSLNRDNHFAFGIINGDITEFGRRSTRDSFDSIYTNNIGFPLFIGLGNHDYANNVNDCSEGALFDFSMNACARGAVFDLSKRINKYKLLLTDLSSDFDEKKQIGSLGYSWDKGDLHFVQLNNYPTYEVELDHYINRSIYITKSLNWLEKDLENALSRGKATILNFHDVHEHFKKNINESDRIRLDGMIKKYNVIAIFSGHTHNPTETNVNFLNNVKNYNSGALYKGDYLFVKVKGKCIDVSIYNGISGFPQKMRELSGVCG